MKQLRSTRSTGSSLIDQYINDCRAVGDSLQVNVQRLTDDIRTMLSACSRSTGKKYSLCHVYISEGVDMRRVDFFVLFVLIQNGGICFYFIRIETVCKKPHYEEQETSGSSVILLLILF